MEIVLIVGLVLLLFGGTKLPQLGKSLGEGIRNFKKGFTGEDETKSANAPPPAQPPSNDAKLSASTPTVQAEDKSQQKVG